ncbi:MAG: 16S rRNA (guanine(966)-N(2))-methyltransferase RsmD [Thermodesulfobacteriota bacterium]
MRIIAGRFRGRKLKGPRPGRMAIRPTSDRARESLFNIIAPRVAGSRLLDLFAGSGAVSLEAISRGAEVAVAVDSGAESLKLIRANQNLCGVDDELIIVKQNLRAGRLDFLGPLAEEHGPFSLVFMDPPYGQGLAVELLAHLGQRPELLSEDPLLIVEEEAEAELPDEAGKLQRQRYRGYGKTGFWFYRYK